MTHDDWKKYIDMYELSAAMEAELLIRKNFPFRPVFEVKFNNAVEEYLVDIFGPRMWDTNPHDENAKWEWFNGPIFRNEHDVMTFILGFNNNA
jgi:hypothetical protein